MASATPAVTPEPPRLLCWRSNLPVLVERLDGLELEMVRIPAGAFVMGSPPEELDHFQDEGPQRVVELKEYLIGQTSITQAQWHAVAEWTEGPGERWGRKLKPNPSFFSDYPDSDLRPLEFVSWHDAMEFCRRLNSRLGAVAESPYTLPSEAQWMYGVVPVQWTGL